MIIEIAIICVSVLLGMGMWLVDRNGKWVNVQKNLDAQNAAIEAHIKSVSDLEYALLAQKYRIDEMVQRETKKALKGGFS
jgi:hypothetical protein